MLKEQEINCYRIQQELLNNILKHSNASKASIKTYSSKMIIKMKVKDNGIGFDFEKVKRAGQKFGLSGLKEREEISNGKFKIKLAMNARAKFFIKIAI